MLWCTGPDSRSRAGLVVKIEGEVGESPMRSVRRGCPDGVDGDCELKQLPGGRKNKRFKL